LARAASVRETDRLGRRRDAARQQPELQFELL